jgi:hypothetical protein
VHFYAGIIFDIFTNIVHLFAGQLHSDFSNPLNASDYRVLKVYQSR